ncbi:MAG: Gfo/Idh/MocA family oxidoreductase [Ruminococcaceae bacterium]|nr:Gfo/Idh/MocA family oxidoreductase [Oscillospiraceae bacterium]MBO4972492.1 Gfo/Idh/MocA family oxidoreductase [Clostridia bacterium]MBQ1258497.1 Gfo/Idh/MocA family oxidoreductase [Clostridia bacterium]
MKKTVIAVIGCGRIAGHAHFPAFAQMDDIIDIKYVCDIIPEKAQAIKEKYPNIKYAIEDYKVALADPEVEAVYVITPNYSHYTITMDALKAGKHVFCEKPITVNYELSCEMAKQAEESGKILNIGVCNRYHKSVEMLEEMNREGKFGKLYHVYCSFRSHRSIPGLGGSFTTKELSGGGVLIDWGIHFFDLILYILGSAQIKTLTCDTYSELAKDMQSYKYKSMWAEDTSDTVNGVNDVEEFVSGYIRTDKAGISFNGAWAQNVGRDEMFIDFLGDKGGARLIYGKKFEFFDGETLTTTYPEYDIPNMYLCESRAFIESVQSGVKNRSHIDNILESAKLLDALYASAEKGTEVTF